MQLEVARSPWPVRRWTLQGRRVTHARRHRSAPMTASALIPAITEPPAPRVSAGRAGETTRPAHPVQLVQAACISAEPGLELASRPRVMGADTRLLHTPSLLRLSKYPRRSVITPQAPPGCVAYCLRGAQARQLAGTVPDRAGMGPGAGFARPKVTQPADTRRSRGGLLARSLANQVPGCRVAGWR